MDVIKKLEWGDFKKKWCDIKPGWHQYKIDPPESIAYASFVNWYADIIDWIYYNIPNCERHCRWAFEDCKFCIKFRYDRDYLFFALRW